MFAASAAAVSHLPASTIAATNMQEASRTANNVTEQAAVKMAAFYDIATRIRIQQENSETGHPSMYGHASDPNVWHVDPEDLMFTVPGMQHGAGRDPQVLATYAGMGSTASQLYPDNPEMVRQAVKNQIQYIGVAHQAMLADPTSSQSGIAVQVGGLHSLYIGNGKYGEDSVSDTSVRPGSVLVADVATPGPQGLLPPAGGAARPGRSKNKVVLQARVADPRSAGAALLLHVREVVKNPTKWRMAMGEHLLGTNAWHAAAKNIINSYMTAVALAVGRLAAAGYVSGTPALAALFGGGGEEGVNLAVADNLAVAVAKVLGVNMTLTDEQLNAPNVRKNVMELRFNLARTIFHDASDLATEFAYIPAGPGNVVARSKARVLRNFAGQQQYKIDTSTDEGKLLYLQNNHFTKAASAFGFAHLRNLSNVIGKATTGGSVHTGGRVHVYLGLNAT